MDASNKRRVDEQNAVFIRGRRLTIFLFVLRRLFEGGVYSSNYGILKIMKQKFKYRVFVEKESKTGTRGRGNCAYGIKSVF